MPPPLSGLRLRARMPLESLVAAFGGSAPTRAFELAVERIVLGRDAQMELMLPTDLAVVAHPRHLPARPGAGVFLTSGTLRRRLPDAHCWEHTHPMWVLAGLLEMTSEVPATAEGPGWDGPASRAGTTIADSAVVSADASIGPGSVVEPQAVIYPGVKLGRSVHVGAGAVIGRPGFGWAFGPDGSRRRMPQRGGVVLEDDVEVGPLCTIDSGTITPTRIGARTALDAHVHVGHNVTIGCDCLVAAQAGFAGSVRIGDRARIGGKAGCSDNVTLGDDVHVAAKAGVIRDVPDGQAVAGFPAVPRTRWLAAMAHLLRKKPGP